MGGSSFLRPPGGRVWLLGLFLLLGLSEGVAAAGRVSAIEGRCFAYLEGSPMRSLREGDEVVQGTRLVTGRDASLTLTFSDESELTLGARTSMTLDRYHFPAPGAGAGDDDDDDEDDAAEEPGFGASLLQGVVRVVTGLIAKRRPASVSFGARVATIGIRGTHFTAEVSGDSATIILLAQAVAGAANAIQVSNQYGSVDIDEPGFGTEIPDANSPPSPPRLMQTSRDMQRILRSVNTTRRVRIPRSPR